MIGANVRYYVNPIVSAEAFDRSLDFHLDLEESIEFNIVLDLDPDRVGEIDLAENLVGL